MFISWNSLQSINVRWRKFCKVILALSWNLGFLSGLLIAVNGNSAFFSLMRAAASCRVSIVGLWIVTLLPFLLSVIAIYFSRPYLIPVISFIHAFTFGYCVCGIAVAFGSAGWLVRWLMLFSAGCSSPIIYWFWLRHISGTAKSLWTDFALCAVVILFITSLDYRIISPFLANLIIH